MPSKHSTSALRPKKKKWWIVALLGAMLVFLMAFWPLKLWCYRLIGKGEFVACQMRDRSGLRAEDRYLYEWLPNQAEDIRLWSFRFNGHWGGCYRIRESLLEAWAQEKGLSLCSDPVVLEVCYSQTSYGLIDTSNGPVYRHSTWRGSMVQRDFLLYYDRKEGIAYFTLSML